MRSVRLAVIVLVLAACAPEPAEESMSFDIVLRGGTVYSGADEQPTVTDVAILGNRIAQVGDLTKATGDLDLDVAGLAVVPGFIDIHSHAVRGDHKEGIFRWPDAENLIRQGVTTVIGGPDGSSLLPIADTLIALEENPASVNYGTFVGHGSVRRLIIGEDDRPPSDKELDSMRAEVRLAMQQGAYGLSSGLIYLPGRFATTEEVVELAKVAAEYDGIYISHMRQEGLDLLKSVAETIRIGEEGGLPTQLTHHKVVGAPMWGKSVDTLAMVDAAIARGVDVSIDQYPYTASSTSLTILFPGFSLDGGRPALLARLADAEQRQRIKEAIVYNIETDRGGDDPANVGLAGCPHDISLNGLNLSQVLRQQEVEVSHENAAELLMDLVAAGNCSAVFHAMDEEDVKRIMAHPMTMPSSDGGVEAPSEKVPHPRNYGTFARVLGYYVREQNVMPFHTAIYKVSGLPAWRIGLSDRGTLEEGAIADIAVLDPETIRDTSTFDNPHQYAQGAHHVFVSGEAVLLNAEMTGARPGKVLRAR
ncbi:MAG: N-acyl-D-amino-acid deacylase [Woeseiaceae bacterium]|jgi:N-acyl-D-amino-acid deacylase